MTQYSLDVLRQRYVVEKRPLEASIEQVLRADGRVAELRVTLDPVYDPDDDIFIQYDVTFSDGMGGHIYIEDLLCVYKRCSVFGKCDDGRMFAFAYLSLGRQTSTWHSKAGRDGMHFAITRAKAAQ